MSPDWLLQRHPAETIRWLRARLGLSRRALATRLEVSVEHVSRWENGRSRIVLAHHRRLVPLLAPRLATQDGVDFVQSLADREGQAC